MPTTSEKVMNRETFNKHTSAKNNNIEIVPDTLEIVLNTNTVAHGKKLLAEIM